MDSIEKSSVQQALKKVPWYSVNVYMIPSKAAYFFEYAKEGAHWPYLVLFYVSVGLHPGKAGLVTGIRFIGGFIGSTFWGWLGDKKRCYKLISLFLCVGAALTTCAQPFIPLVIKNPGENNCSEHGKNRSNETATVENNNKQHENSLFYSLIAISILASFFDGSTVGFVDSGVLRCTLNSPQKTDIGRQRYFGPIGYAVGAFFSGLISDYFPHCHISPYTGIFIIYFLCCACLSVSSHFLFKNVSAPAAKNTAVRSDTNVNRMIFSKLKTFDTWFFLATILFNGMATGVAFSYSFLYLKELNAPSVLMGAAMYVNGISAGVFFILSKKIVTLVHGPMNGMSLSCASWGIRYLCLSYMGNPLWYVFINALNGLTSSLFMYSYVDYLKQTYPPAIFSAICGISSALYYSGGHLVANMFAGILYENLGPRVLFLYCGVTCFIWALMTYIYGVVQICRNKTNKVGVIAYHVDQRGDKTVELRDEPVDLQMFSVY